MSREAAGGRGGGRGRAGPGGNGEGIGSHGWLSRVGVLESYIHTVRWGTNGSSYNLYPGGEVWVGVGVGDARWEVVCAVMNAHPFTDA